MLHRYLVLGLLSRRPMSGYDIKKHVKESLGAVTNASYGTLYPMLHKLLAQEAVAMQEVPQTGRPSKKVYRITDKGRQELESWLREPASADQVRREFLLKLYLAKDLSADDLRELIATRHTETKALLETLRQELDTIKDQQHSWVLQYEVAAAEAELGWLKKLEKQLATA